jgi:hypothetical protein
MMSPMDYIKIYVYNGTVTEYAKLAGVSVRDALDTLYKSQLYSLIRRGVSDMHCRSNGYLAEDLQMEVNRTHHWA